MEEFIMHCCIREAIDETTCDSRFRLVGCITIGVRKSRIKYDKIRAPGQPNPSFLELRPVALSIAPEVS